MAEPSSFRVNGIWAGGSVNGHLVLVSGYRLAFGSLASTGAAISATGGTALNAILGDDSDWTTFKAKSFVVSSGANLITSNAAFTDGAAAQTGTLTNAPTAGNPTKWIPINDNGTTRYIPAW